MMIATHLIFVVLAAISFVGRIVVAEIQPSLLKKKRYRVVPDIIDTFLLLSGIALVIERQWPPGEYDWFIAKLTALLGYIGFGVLALRIRGTIRWLAFAGSMICFAYIAMVAVTKKPLLFL